MQKSKIILNATEKTRTSLANFTAGLALSNTPLLLLKNSQIMLSNPAANACLRESEVFKIKAGVLRTRRKSETDAIKALSAELEDPSVESGQRRVLPLRNRAGQVIIILHFQSAEFPVTGRVVLLRIADLHQRPQLDRAWLTEVFSLTHSEARVVAGIYAGHDIAATAELFGLGVETVRSQLKSAMGKLGVRSQSQLIALLSAAKSAADMPDDPNVLDLLS